MTETYLPGGRWRLWEQFALRGPGFPARGVLRLAPAGLAAAADKFPDGEQLSGEDWAAFGALFAEAAVENAHALQDIARLPAFREAVAWQNRPVLSSGIAPFLNWTPTAAGRTSMPRQREELVAHYWQRFCVKNDTIGFFGPVGWGRWDLGAEGPDGIAVDPGTGLIADSRVYFASWAIDALAAAVGADPALRDGVAPRRVPFVRLADVGDTAGDTGIEGAEVLVPGRPPQLAGAAAAAVLALCDGVRTAREIAAALPGTDVPAELAALVARRWVVWKLEVPADARPERYLRAWLERIADPGARGRALAALDVLERGRDLVAAAEGPEALVEAMSALEGEFVALTETAAVREKSAGTAPCRALVYSDCRRSATATLGRAVHEALAPLEPLLTSAGWLTARLADAVMARATEVYERLAARGPVDLAAFWFACMPILHGAARTETEALQREFRARWAAVLSPSPDARRVRLTLADIAGPVAERFGEGSAGAGSTGTGGGVRGGWTAARYLSPDIMIAATGTDAVARGDFELVLGELHLAANTLGSSLFVHQHPDARELTALTDRDHPGPRLMPLLPKEHRSRLSVRTRHALVRPEDYHVALVDFTADPARPRTVLSADVTVTRADDGELRAVLPDGAEFAAVDVFAHVLTTLAMDLFQILPDDAEHSPRVTVDRLVVARETWRLPQDGIDFADEKDEARRFVRARRWRARHGLPRFVFVVLPTETRPFYVDFDSPVYLSILAKALRRLARNDPDGRAVITEMLPSPEEAWLTDDQGAAYTSELRFVAVDEG
ncbi:lantibiotic dehydratase family protein [Streptomyces sp. NBC_00536]|uniref:lantibiotic dehydratase n=1 Tax=Streptomyces sp. NBC_00536 TaxID=2975769 RepID=UPI002E80C018|nr:lantibiotic dehydratase [Streptomyces sp. NBC_00536]WUC77800.1 lantibiotic dehydratase family protein [Streptomyces sp. NBC_00536]